MLHTLRPTVWQSPRSLSGCLLLVVNEYLTRASRYNRHEGIIAGKWSDVPQNSG